MNLIRCAGRRPVRGAIHVHTDYCDGDGSVESVVETADQAGLDYLILTDHHDTYAMDDDWQGRGKSGRLLVVVGAEYRSKDRYDFLAVGPRGKVATRSRPCLDAMELLGRIGDLVIVAHPQGHQRLLFARLNTWRDYHTHLYDGLEIWAYMHDWIRHLSWRRLPDMCRFPDKYIRGPEPKILKAWDEQAKKRVVAGIGALDSHGKRLPLGLSRLFNWAQEGILPYRQNFEALSHYALVPDHWGQDDHHDQEELVTSLRMACGWVCHEKLASGRDFVFQLEDSFEHFAVGTETSYGEGQRLQVSSPQRAHLIIRRHGQIAAETEGRELEFTPEHPGEYRVEAFLDHRPWIFSNHIYLRS